MYTLLIDTHFTKVNLVLYKDNKVEELISEESMQSHSVITMPLLDKLLKNNQVDVTEIKNIIVVNGPGSFTGVRIGVTIAKTMAFALNIPIRVISSIELLVVSLSLKEPKIAAISDKNGYYVGKFDKNNNLIEDYFYLSNKEYFKYKEKNKIYEDDSILDYNKIFEFAIRKDIVNPHLVNPIYIKKIGVQQ